MVTTVRTEAQLNTALANNSDDIIFGADITVTTYNDYQFTHNIDGDGHTLTLNIPSSSQGSHWAFVNSFTGEMHHLEVTGVINVTDVSYANNGAPMFVHMGDGGYIHDIIIDDLTISGNFTYGASWALFGSPDHSNAVIENIWINNFKVEAQTSNARFFIVGQGATVDRISISNSNSIFPVTNRWSHISNGYIYNSNLNHAPAISGAAYYASDGSDLYVHSNVTWSGGTKSESDFNGRTNDNPDFERIGFTIANNWIVSSGYPQLNLKPIPIITNVSASPTTGSVTTQIALSATVVRATSYQWQYSTNGGSTWTNISGATAAAATWTPGAVGTYQVHLVATNASGFPATSEPVTVTIYDVPTVTATASPTQGPLTQQITLSATVIDPAPGSTTYQWEEATSSSGPWTSISGATTKTYQYSYSGSATTKYFRLIATGVGGAGYSNTVSYTAYNAPTAVASVLPPLGTAPLQVSYSVETTGNVQSYQWELKIDDGAWEQLSTTASGTYIASATGTYQFRVTVTGYGGSTTSNTVTVEVIDQGVKITAPPEGSNIFVGFPVNFTCSVAAVTNPVYSWSDGHTTPSFTKTFDTTGAQTMSVTVTGDEGTFTASVSFNIVAREDFSITAPSTFANNVPVTFTASNEPDSVVWHFPNETESGFTVTKTFSGYSKGTVLNVTAVGTFTDDLNNSYETTHSVTLKCVYPYSYYENPRGEKFYFDEYCTILRAGKSGFSEIQVNTDVQSGHDYNTVSGLTINDRVITMNIYVKGNYATMHAKRREMVHIMAPQKELGTFSYTRDDGEIFTMRCNIALGSPIFSDEAVSNGWVGTISFVAPNGVWEGAEVTASTDNFIKNIGDIPCGFEATLTGNLVNATNSESMLATSGTLSGYKINTTEGTVTKKVGGEWVDAWEDISLNSTLVVLEVGNNTITGCSSITFKPLYLGV